jgi:glutathione synthase/RimK-type ligase-like ATP-grasp enzyme
MSRKDSVLILAPEDDIHAQVVAHVLKWQLDTPAVIWNIAHLPARDPATFRLGVDGSTFSIKTPDVDIAVDSLRSIWWRRTTTYRISDAVSDPQVRDFCQRECDAFFRGALAALSVPIVNDPVAERAARKPIQLQIVHKAGLIIPETIMSSDPQEVRAFWERLGGNCIYKVFTSPRWRMAETRSLFEEDLAHLETLQYAPIIVQEKVEKLRDIRVTIFGEKLFAASICINLPLGEIDWRLDLTAQWEKYEIPADIAQKLIDVLRALGLQYGCFDLRQRPDGAYVFFEVNPSGQFLFIEIDTDQPLARACAELLLEPRFACSILGPENPKPVNYC